MPLKTGIYHIHWVPKHIKFPFVGGVYATGDLINAPVRAEALNPLASGNQKWRVEVVERKKDTYRISYPGFLDVGVVSPGIGPVVPGWATAQRGHTEPVTLSTTIAEWLITVVDEANGVYRVSEPHGEIVGAVRSVTEENDLLYVKSYSIIEDITVSLPSWQFVRLSD